MEVVTYDECVSPNKKQTWIFRNMFLTQLHLFGYTRDLCYNLSKAAIFNRYAVAHWCAVNGP